MGDLLTLPGMDSCQLGGLKNNNSVVSYHQNKMPLLYYWEYLLKTVTVIIFRVYSWVDWIAPTDTMRVTTQETGFLVISSSSCIPYGLVSEICVFFWNSAFPSSLGDNQVKWQ